MVYETQLQGSAYLDMRYSLSLSFSLSLSLFLALSRTHSNSLAHSRTPALASRTQNLIFLDML